MFTISSVGVDQTILKLEAPLTSIRADVETIRTSLDDEIQLINTKLQQRNDIRTKQVNSGPTQREVGEYIET